MDKYEDIIVSILTPLVYLGVIIVVMFIGVCELFKIAVQYYPTVKKWIAEKYSHIY